MVETTNFREDTGLYGGDQNLYLTERFTPLENGDLLYDFTVQDDTADPAMERRTSGNASRLRCTNTPVTKELRRYPAWCRCWKAAQAAGSNHRVASDI